MKRTNIHNAIQLLEKVVSVKTEDLKELLQLAPSYKKLFYFKYKPATTCNINFMFSWAFQANLSIFSTKADVAFLINIAVLTWPGDKKAKLWHDPILSKVDLILKR